VLGITAIAQDAIAALGTPTTFVAVNGLSTTATAGNVSFNITGSVQLNTNNITTTLGGIQVDPDVIAGSQLLNTQIGPYSVKGDALAVILQGENELETSTGTVSLTIDGIVSATGNNITTAAGTVDTIFAVNPVGVSVNTIVGTNTSVIGTAVLQVSGNPMTLDLGNETAVVDVSVSVSSLSTLNVSQNSVTVNLNTPVDLTSNPMTASLGNVGTVGWSDVNQNVSNTWTNVNQNVTNVWTEVDIAA
jgi:hypothetical protein